MHIFFLVLSIILAVIAQIFFKYFSLLKNDNQNLIYYFLDLRLIIGFSLYFISALFYIISLKKINLSVAYTSVSISYVFIIILSHFLFKEPLSLFKIIGSIFIIFGVSLICK
jgi:multidrug transporter EmrE-like cation transporter